MYLISIVIINRKYMQMQSRINGFFKLIHPSTTLVKIVSEDNQSYQTTAELFFHKCYFCVDGRSSSDLSNSFEIDAED